MLKTFLNLIKPAKHIQQLPTKESNYLYPYYRWVILETTFLGYASFYFVRKNLNVIQPKLGAALGYDNVDLGILGAGLLTSYGLGKFIMGALSDRSNPRYFMALGLLLSALCNFIFASSSNFWIHFFIWSANGMFQGMGWPPCGRSLGHWFSLKERGTIFAIWNTAHNVGGGLIALIVTSSVAYFGDWQYAFYVPGIISVLFALYLFIYLRDTPQSLGLPSIEVYKNQDYDHAPIAEHENELSTKELFLKFILTNKYLWIFAFANFFVYIARYSMVDWGPTYLTQAKGADFTKSGMTTLILEFAGIPSTIIMGFLSDKLGGKRGLVSLLCMIPVFFAFWGLSITPNDMVWMDEILMGVIGFFIYPPVMLLGVAALDLTSKKAVGTAAGFIGMFGYAGAASKDLILGYLSKNYGWDAAFIFLLICVVICIFILSFTVKIKPES